MAGFRKGERRQNRATFDPAAVYSDVRNLVTKGRFERAGEILEAAIEDNPLDPDLLGMLAGVRYHLGAIEDSGSLLQKAIALTPDNPHLVNNLGNIKVSLGDAEAAEACFRRAIELDLSTPAPFNNLAMVVKSRGRLEEAARLLRRAIALKPDFGLAHSNLSAILMKLGDDRGALDHGMKAVALIQNRSAPRQLLVLAHVHGGDMNRALQVAKEWVSQQPNDPEARHILAALEGKDVPARAPDDYVEQLFDDFAESFDAKLSDLGYKAPQLLRDGLVRNLPADLLSGLDILDAGCGTGLCGPLLRDFARRLVGMDLSSKMLEQARRGGFYDRLDHAEITRWCRDTEESFDLIVSADTLCYFGDLADVSAAFAHVLKPGGHLAFTLETAGEGETFRLMPSGRYQHRKDYARQVVEASGFSVLAIEDIVARNEDARPVEGMLILASIPER